MGEGARFIERKRVCGAQQSTGPDQKKKKPGEKERPERKQLGKGGVELGRGLVIKRTQF